MNSPIISFCIATFQRYEILYELVQEILSVETDKIEVVVCDDKSLDDSLDKIKKIEDCRLKIYVNEKNVGSSLNIHESLDKGKGRYLFYVNDRDNVDKFKIKKLIDILEDLEKKDVALAKCSNEKNIIEKYRIVAAGKDALLQFACRMDHPTGYIFKRDHWRRIKNKRILFENQNYGDYPITQVCAILAKDYKGAWIYGDICDVERRRINFSEVKSGYYKKRKDKRLWYTPEVIFRELKTGQKFLEKLGVSKDISNQILVNRYIEYLSWCVTSYKSMISDPSCTAHNNFYPPQDFFHVFMTSIINGIKLWSRTIYLCSLNNKQICPAINKASRQEYVKYFKSIWKGYIKKNSDRELEGKNYEIYKRDKTLNVYESWIDTIIAHNMISDHLFRMGIRHIALYGMGRIGRNLFKEFYNSGIYVDYIIDRSMSKYTEYYEHVPCLDINSTFPYVDIIIVTVSGEAEEIIKELREKGVDQVKSIDDILFVV